MQDYELPSPDIGGKGFHLRRIAANAITQNEISALNYTGGVHPSRTVFAKFFASCLDAVLGSNYITPMLAFTPDFKSYSIAGGAAQAGPALALDGSAGAVTYTSSDVTKATVNSATGAITPLVAGTTRIVASIAATATYRAFSRSYLATITA